MEEKLFEKYKRMRIYCCISSNASLSWIVYGAVIIHNFVVQTAIRNSINHIRMQIFRLRSTIAQIGIYLFIFHCACNFRDFLLSLIRFTSSQIAHWHTDKLIYSRRQSWSTNAISSSLSYSNKTIRIQLALHKKIVKVKMNVSRTRSKKKDSFGCSVVDL